MSAQATIDRLMSLHPKGYDLSLGRITRLLDRLGNPQDRIPPAIHVAGTNGKGSATAFCRALLESAGLRVHVHTSPHLVTWHERFRIGARPVGMHVDDATLNDALLRVEAANGGESITVFEIMTAVMFVLFAEHEADASIIEVGLGGRFDATNLIRDPAATLIMPIALDHMAQLGGTVEKIAFEKAGIFKPGCPAVIGQQAFEAARNVLIARAEEVSGQAPFIYGQDFMAHEEHGRMVYQDEDGLFDLPLPALPGRHQIANAAAAIRAVKAAGFAITQTHAETAMETVTWPARMQRLREGALVDLLPKGSELFVDGGHNGHAAIAIAEAVAAREEQRERPFFLIAAMLDTKEPRPFFEPFGGLVRHVFTVPVPGSEAGIDPEDLAEAARAAGLSAQACQSVTDALTRLGGDWNGLEASPRVLIGGSLYLAGDVLRENGTLPV